MEDNYIYYIMDKLPSKSLSKSILIATPLFCIVLALLDASDDLSYLFVLDFLGSVDLMFLPTTQPQIRSPSFDRNYAFKMQGVNISDEFQATTVPIVRLDVVEGWARNHTAVRGVSPRWIVPVELPRTDSLLLVINSTRELEMGVGLQSGLQKLGAKEVALSAELMHRLGVKIGDSVSMTITVPGLLRGGRLIEKYQSFESREEYVVDNEELGVDQVTDLLFRLISTRGQEYGFNPTRQDIHKVVEEIYNTQFIMTYKVKNQYKNKGLYPTTLHNVVLMEFEGFAQFLTELVKAKVINSRPLQDAFFNILKNANLSPAQMLIIRTYYRSIRNGNLYNDQIRKYITQAVVKFPLMVISSFKNREAIYSPDNKGVISLLDAMQSSPGEFQVISIYPFYQDLQGIRFFFKSVIQIFSFICAVIYYYIMTLIFKQIYEEKEIEVGIWRTLGAGGVRVKEDGKKGYAAFSDLKERLSLKEKVSYAYKMMVKVGFLYYWLVSAAISAFLYWLMKLCIYELIVSILNFSAPPQEMIYPILVFVSVFTFTIGLAILHIRQIYINPLVSTIKPVKRTFDLVKVRIVKIATFGITVQTLIIAVMLIYYGVVSYYEIPMSILYNDGWLQTILFNSIFICMIFGAIILLSIFQSRMECLILKGLFKVSQRLRRTKLILLKTIKAKQYKNIKVAIIISVIFAFLLFFASGLRIQTTIIQSFIQRQLGAELVLENYEANTFDRPKVEKYLDSVGGLRYSWLSSDLDNRKVQLIFQGIMKNEPVTAIFKIVSSNYLNTTYYEYYYPQKYFDQEKSNYEVLPNGVVNGFSALFTQGGSSRGKYNPSDTIREYDPKHMNIDAHSFRIHNASMQMAPQEQVINLVVTSQLRKRLGAAAGDYFKLHVSNAATGVQYLIRCRVLHSLKIGPGLDLFSSVAFFSQEQAEYLYRIVGADPSEIRFEKLFIAGQDLSAVGNKILSISPQHTQLFEMGLVRESFETMTNYLQGFIALVTVILASLSILFLFVYTHGKCKEEAEVFKMLRAIGLPVSDIRLIIFIEILIRIVVSIFNGILLGIFFSLGLSGQIQEVLMINTPPIKLDSILIIAVLMLVLFSATVMRSTQYLSTRTVLETSKG